MKKNFYYYSLLLGLVLGMTMFTACGGDDDDNGAASGGASGGGAGGFTPGKFMGPKRVFGDNLLSSFGRENGTCYELTYNSDDFVTNIKSYRIDAIGQKNYSGNDYEVTYSGNQVIVTYSRPSGSTRQYTFTIGNNGFAESWTTDGKGGAIAKVKCDYDSDGHLTKLTVYERGEDQPITWIGTFTWQDGNLTKANDNDSWSYKSLIYTYGTISNIAGIFIGGARVTGDISDFYEDEFHYIGLLGKGTANLVSSFGRSDDSSTSENAWTLDDAGRPTKCVTTTTGGGGGTPTTSTYFWTYR